MALAKDTIETKTKHTITCKLYRPRPNQKHCIYFLPNGVCYRPGSHLCIEWLRINKNIQKFVDLKAEAARIDLIAFCEEQLGTSPFSLVGLNKDQPDDDPFELPVSPTNAPQGDLRRSKLNTAINTHELAKAKQGPPVAATNDHSFKLQYSPKPITTGVPASQDRKLQYLVSENAIHGNPPSHKHGTNGTASSAKNIQDIVVPTFNQEEIDSFRALEAEVCIDAHAGEIWIVPRYTQADRIEFVPEDLEFLFATRSTFPGSTIAKVTRIQSPTKETAHAK